jgi:hypothetical protein
MTHPEQGMLRSSWPYFGWAIEDDSPRTYQTAYRILVASSPEYLTQEKGDFWDSGKTHSSQSLNLPYTGAPLQSHADYYWQVRVWDEDDQASPWSIPQHFRTGTLVQGYHTAGYALQHTEIAPQRVVQKGKGRYFVDFGKAAFGTVRVTLTADKAGRELECHLGEALESGNTLDRSPPGCVRYRMIRLALKKGTHTYTVEIPADQRNTGTLAIRTPATVGEVMPFRYCELVGCPSPLDESNIRQVAVHYPFNEDASDFLSSNQTLNDIWRLCKYTIKATSFCGLYVDGDRERIPYEADAYINQLCHYCVDREFTLARRTHEYLILHPTWPTEWILHSILMAWADYEYTGDDRSLQAHYAHLQAKALTALAREDGLISTRTDRLTPAVMESVRFGRERQDFFGKQIQDLVDWPPGSFTQGGVGERDGYEMVDVNTVVNAFYYRALVLMHRIATHLGKEQDARTYNQLAEQVGRAFNKVFFDEARGIYVDGEGSTHASLHANMMPLAFDLVPLEYRHGVVAFIKSRGMACSVYGAQYLLEGLYRANEAQYALDLLLANDDRSWANMLRVGSTMTLEAWDWKYKNNLDWNHAWGAAPANIIPRYLMGVRPLEPGFGKVLIQPQPGNLASAQLRLPTIRGTIRVGFERHGKAFKLEVDLPGNITARVALPIGSIREPDVTLDGVSVIGLEQGGFIVIDGVPPGRHLLSLEDLTT